MEFYKILYQAEKKNRPRSPLNQSDIVFGTNQNAFGIRYSPEKYNKLLNDEEVFSFFIENSIKQLLMTNFKFITLINFRSEFQLELIDFKCKNEVDYSDFLKEDLELNYLGDWIDNYDLEISQVYFRLNNAYLISIKSNGVLGFDSAAYDCENYCIEKLISFLGFGPVHKL